MTVISNYYFSKNASITCFLEQFEHSQYLFGYKTNINKLQKSKTGLHSAYKAWNIYTIFLVHKLAHHACPGVQILKENAINSFLTDDNTRSFVDSVDQDKIVQNAQSYLRSTQSTFFILDYK